MNRASLFFRCISALCINVLTDATTAAKTDQSIVDSAPATAPARLTATAVQVAEGPTLDGAVLDDPIWAQAPVISGFWQEQPDEGHPSSETTEVRMIYTSDTLYVGVVCYDRDPSSIVVSDSRRDAALDDSDSFQMIFDTYRDRQNGFVFGTNPAAIEYDGQVTNEGQGGGGTGGGGNNQQTGSGGGFNLNWDGAWEVQARIDERGCVLGADSTAIQPLSPVARRIGRRHPDPGGP
jgi:hypothetical protein